MPSHIFLSRIFPFLPFSFTHVTHDAYQGRWVWSFFIKNFGKEVTVTDLEKVPKRDESGTLGQKLSKEWDKELVKQRSGKKKQASLLAAIHRVFGLEYALHGIALTFTQGLLPILQTLVMGFLVQQLADISEKNAEGPELDRLKNWTYIWGGILVFLQGLMVLLMHPYFFNSFR